VLSFASSDCLISHYYFGIAQIGRVYPDAKSTKGDHFTEVQSYRAFDAEVFAKHDGDFIEVIPESRVSNYWRDGVRPITQEIYQRIQSLASLTEPVDSGVRAPTNDNAQGLPESLESGVEGHPGMRVVSTYERDPKLREAAIRIHGTTCVVCGFNFAEVYGQHGAGYVQVHHLVPLADGRETRIVKAKTDLTVLCANCHVMVHRYRKKTLTIEQLKALIAEFAI